MNKLVLPIIACLILCGCCKSADISSLGYLLAVGVDKKDDNNIYTLQFANPIGFAGKESGTENDTVKSISINANSLNGALAIASNKILKEIDTSYLKLIVFNKDVSINDTVAMMQKTSQFHPDTYIAFSNCDAADVLEKINSPLEINPARFYDNLFNNLYNEYSPPVTIKYAGFNSGLIPLIDKDFDCNAVAVFDQGKIIEIRSKNDGKILNIVSGNIRNFEYEIKPHNLVLKLSSRSKPIIVINKTGQPVINIKLSYSGEILENKSDIIDVGKLTEEQIETEIKNFIKYYYTENNIDILDLKKMFKKRFWFNYEWADFEKKINAADIIFKVNVDIDIKRDGIMLKEIK